jgi:peptide deformylase
LAVRPILEIPDPILRRRARKVQAVDSSVLRLAHDMVDTMRDSAGVGLAANQVGDLRRVIVLQMPEEDEARIYINPEIIRREGEREVEEGCLSIPGYRGFITRSVTIRFRALDHEAKVVKIKADELLAQALEHEVDHLNGILYTDHLASHEKLFRLESRSDEAEDEEDDSEDSSHDERLSVPTDQEILNILGSGSPPVDAREAPATLKIR